MLGYGSRGKKIDNRQQPAASQKLSTREEEISQSTEQGVCEVVGFTYHINAIDYEVLENAHCVTTRLSIKRALHLIVI